jgi:hypothetical protein
MKKTLIETQIIIGFRNQVSDAIIQYGRKNVWNMDESPAPTVDRIGSRWNHSNEQLSLDINGNDKTKNPNSKCQLVIHYDKHYPQLQVHGLVYIMVVHLID